VRVVGGRPLRAVVKHIVPNAIGTIIVQATFAVADSILTLSVLGFLTLGVAPPSTDWGSMLSGGLTYIQGGNYWWLIYPPGVLIILICISFNFIGDALRDAFETRLQRRLGGVVALLEITDLRTEIQLRDGVVHAVDD